MIDANEIRKTLEVFKTDNGLIEIRIFSTLNKSENYSGIFDNADDLMREVMKFDKDPYNTYFVFNELKDALRGYPQLNKMLRGAATVKDENIKYRKWILIDLDPIREGGVKEIASTDEEMEQARKKAHEVRSFLLSCGMKQPVVCASGNGFHLMFKIDNVPNTAKVDTDIKNFLNYLSMKFSSSIVDCDIKVKNAARLTKFYSSVSRKGGDTKERPHRQSKILVVPPTLECSDFAIIEKFSEEFAKIAQPEDPNRKSRASYNGDNNVGGKFDIYEFLSRNGLEILKEDVLDGNTKKIVLKECPFDKSHGKDSAIFVSDKGIVFTCFHNGCSGKTWRDLRLMFEPHAYDYEANYQPNYYQQPKLQKPSRQEYKIKEETKETGKKWLSMSDVEKIDLTSLFSIKTGFSELDQKIVGLYEGEITILSGSNSSGKSSWINTLILNVINQGVKVALWSGELPAEVLKTWLQQSAAGKNYLKESKYEKGKYYVPQNVGEKIDAWMEGKFFLYNNEFTNRFEQIFNDMEILVKEGVKLFILDNLFSLDIDGFEGDKNNKQKELILKLGEFVKKKKIHIMLVCHPRKVTSFLRKTDISGTADLANAASNIFIIHRVNKDFERMGGEFFGANVVTQYMTFGNVIECAKNRLYGAVDVLVGMFYEIATRRFKNYDSEYVHYGWENEFINHTQTKIEYVPTAVKPNEQFYKQQQDNQQYQQGDDDSVWDKYTPYDPQIDELKWNNVF